MVNKTQHTVVIGGGVIGGFSAWYLRQTGRDVTLIDKGRFGKACSHGNCGFVSPSHVIPLAQSRPDPQWDQRDAQPTDSTAYRTQKNPESVAVAAEVRESLQRKEHDAGGARLSSIAAIVSRVVS